MRAICRHPLNVRCVPLHFAPLPLDGMLAIEMARRGRGDGVCPRLPLPITISQAYLGIALNMFEDPELPDFESMSQEELIEWLEELTKMQGGAASEFIDDVPDADGRNPAEDPDSEADETWAPLLDDPPPAKIAPAPAANGDGDQGDEFADADEETLIDLARFESRNSGPLDAAAMAWLAEISAAESEEELPDITDYRQPAPPPENLDELLAQGAKEVPLDWLDNLGNRPAGARLPVAANEPPDQDKEAAPDAEYGDDFDDAYEDDEQLDDLEDESLYSRRSGETQQVLQSIMGMQGLESEEYSTQSMAPVPENVQGANTDEARAVPAKTVVEQPEVTAGADDSLTQAFMLHEGPVDLEAWYSGRLRAISATGDGPPKPAAVPALDQIAAPSKPPPPGLAAAIYSARGKVDANDLREALTDYETLLRTSAGLEWVVSDMRGLIARDGFRRNPSVHRVLGDALMRQGQLDAALDVYRHALTLL